MNRISLMFVSCLAAAVAGAPALARAAPTGTTPSMADEAASALVRGDAQQAVANYTEALKDTGLPNDRRAALLSDRGVAYSKLGYAACA